MRLNNNVFYIYIQYFVQKSQFDSAFSTRLLAGIESSIPYHAGIARVNNTQYIAASHDRAHLRVRCELKGMVVLSLSVELGHLSATQVRVHLQSCKHRAVVRCPQILHRVVYQRTDASRHE
jgi:hypothetical protein